MSRRVMWSGRLSFAVVAAIAASSSADVLIVSPDGSGRFTDISTAIEAANEGDTIVVAAGRYHLTDALRLDKRALKIAGVAGQRPVLMAPADKPAVVHILADGVQLQDLILQGGFYGVKIEPEDDTPVRGVTIRNCTISSTAADAVKSYRADDLKIEYCQIGPTGLQQHDNAEGIDIIASVKVLIRGCVIEQTATNGIYFKGGTRDGVVERCLVRHTGHGGILLGQDTDPEYMRDQARFEAINCTAQNNIIVDTQTAGLGTYSGQNISFVNNTLLDTAKSGQASIWIVTNEREVPAEKVVLRNNIIGGSGKRPAIFIKDAAGLPDSDHNLFWGPKDVRIVREITADASLNRDWSLQQWREATGMDRHSRIAEPGVDTLRFRPALSSAAIGAGQQVKGMTDDYYGKTRSQWDIGAVAAAVGQVAAATLPAR